jgi:hypothetical protein|tara:strand:+ start:966 stop:2270 length:1305 start_codon:yes stop_codon:yes gene_type:complete
MAEQMTIDQMLAGMTDEEKAQFIDQMTYQQNAGRLNKNQKAIAGLPGISQPYNYQKPEGFGGAIKNIGKNILRPGMERLGLAPSIQGQLANMQYQQFLRQNYETESEYVREEMGRNFLRKRGVPERQIQAMSGDELKETIRDVVGVVQRGELGNTYQTRLGTGERVNEQTLPPAMQQFLFDNPEALARFQQGSPNVPLNPAQEVLSESEIPSFSDYEIGKSSRMETNKLAAQSNNALGKTYNENSQTAYSQQNALEYMLNLVSSPGFESGTGQQALTAVQSLGYNLGVTSKSPVKEEVFQALSRQIIIPLVKQLGVNPTDKDFEIIESASVGLGQTIEGNLILLQAAKIGAERFIITEDAYQQFTADNIKMKASQPLRFEANWKIALSKLKKTPQWQGDLLESLNLRTRQLTGDQSGQINAEDLGASFAGDGVK